MYLSHFGLNQSPFGITPNPVFFFTGNKRGDILEALMYAITHGEGIIKVTGEVGSGKTMLCRMLETMLPQNVEVIYLINPTLNPKEVVYAIASELGLDTNGKRVDEVIRLLQSDLITKHVTGKQVVLLVEEAQAMPLETLEEIRLYSNLETAHHKLLQIVLFGQPELNENLALPRMRQLKERITHSFDVPPLTLSVIPEFLMFRMRAAGYHGPNIFSKNAIKLLASVSEGIVRRISILADKSLLAAFADNTHSIEAKHVKAAIYDSEFSEVVAARSRRRKLAVALLSSLIIAAITAWIFLGSNAKSSSATAQPNKPSEKATILNKNLAITPTKVIPPPQNAAPASPVANSIQTAKTIEKPITANAETLTSTTNLQKLSSTAPAASLLQTRLTLSKAWLSNETPEHYSIQLTLMAADKLPQIERFLRKTQAEIGAEQIYIYPSRVGTSPRFGVVYNSYPTRAEALAALVELSDQWGYRPQLRTIVGIREEIKRSNSEDMWPQ